MVQRLGYQPGLPTLIDLQLELGQPYGDLRREYTKYAAKDLFYMRIGEWWGWGGGSGGVVVIIGVVGGCSGVEGVMRVCCLSYACARRD